MTEAIYDYYEDFAEGQTFEPFLCRVSAEDLAVLDNCINLKKVTGPDGQVLPAPATDGTRVSPFLLNSFLPMRARVKMPDGLLHARETLRMHGFAQVGDELQTVMTVKARYEKNNRKFLEFEHVVSRVADGQPLMTFDRTIAWVNK